MPLTWAKVPAKAGVEDNAEVAEDVEVKLVQLESPRPLDPSEHALISFLLSGPLGRTELQEQVPATHVVATCSCGCPSIGLEVETSATPARFSRQDSPTGDTGWVPITAYEPRTSGPDAEVTLHVVDGYLAELEIWAGRYGARPRIDPARLKHSAG